MSVSIVIPVYNQQKYLGRAIRSAIASRVFCDVEILVINDASTDHTQDVLDSFGDSVRVIQNDTNSGLPFSLNRGIRFSTGKYIVRLDSDDWIHAKLPEIMSFFLDLNNSIDAVASDYYIVDETQERKAHMSSLENPIGCAIMFRKEHLIDIGLYDQEMLWHEERELMHRFKKKYNIHHIPLPLYRYYIHGSNMTLNDSMMNKYDSLYLDKTRNQDHGFN